MHKNTPKINGKSPEIQNPKNLLTMSLCSSYRKNW